MQHKLLPALLNSVQYARRAGIEPVYKARYVNVQTRASLLHKDVAFNSLHLFGVSEAVVTKTS